MFHLKYNKRIKILFSIKSFFIFSDGLLCARMSVKIHRKESDNNCHEGAFTVPLLVKVSFFHINCIFQQILLKVQSCWYLSEMWIFLISNNEQSEKTKAI